MTGYSEEKADRMIEEHQEEAERLREEADARDTRTFGQQGDPEVEDLRAAADRHDQAVENLEALKDHWGD